MCELHACCFLGHVLDVFLFDFDAVGLYELFLDEVPFELFDACLVVVFHKLLALVFIVVEHYSFEQRVGELQLAHFVFYISARVEQEFVVGVCGELCLDAFGNLAAELGLVFYGVFTVYRVEQFLIDFALYEARYFGNLIGEVGRGVCDGVFFLF